MTFSQLTVSSICHFVINMLLHWLSIASLCCFVKMPYHPLVLSSTWHSCSTYCIICGLGQGGLTEMGRLSTEDLLIRVARFVNKLIMFAISKAADLNWLVQEGHLYWASPFSKGALFKLAATSVPHYTYKLLALPANLRLGCKDSPWTNTLAYFVTKKAA